MSHTPGPWQVLTKLTGSENHKGYRIWAEGGWIGDLSPRDPDGKGGLENANLIAAAPDMLEALEGLDLDSMLDRKAADAVREAIAKAKGTPR